MASLESIKKYWHAFTFCARYGLSFCNKNDCLRCQKSGLFKNTSTGLCFCPSDPLSLPDPLFEGRLYGRKQRKAYATTWRRCHRQDWYDSDGIHDSSQKQDERERNEMCCSMVSDLRNLFIHRYVHKINKI